MSKLNWNVVLLISCLLAGGYAYADETTAANTPAPAPTAINGDSAVIKPYRTFIQFMRYNMESNGETANPISNVRLEVTFPNGNKVQLPEGGHFWPIQNGQSQEINRTFELPWAYVTGDGFKFQVLMVRKGSGPFLPCEFDIVQLSQFNRSYTCHTDVGYQATQHVAPEAYDKEGIQIRVFTDRNSEPKEIPNDSLAIR